LIIKKWKTSIASKLTCENKSGSEFSIQGKSVHARHGLFNRTVSNFKMSSIFNFARALRDRQTIAELCINPWSMICVQINRDGHGAGSILAKPSDFSKSKPNF